MVGRRSRDSGRGLVVSVHNLARSMPIPPACHYGGMAQPRTLLAGPAWRPSPKAKLLWTLQPAGGWASLLVAVAVWAVLDTGNRGWQLLAAVTALVAGAVAVAVVPRWRYAVHRREGTPEGVYRRVGWMCRASRCVALRPAH